MTLVTTPAWLLAFGHMWGWGAGGWAFGIIMMLFWVALVVLVVLLLVRAYGHGTHAATAPPGGPPEPPREEPLEIARRRFAAGEISKEQFEDIEKTLKGS